MTAVITLDRVGDGVCLLTLVTSHGRWTGGGKRLSRWRRGVRERGGESGVSGEEGRVRRCLVCICGKKTGGDQREEMLNYFLRDIVNL